MRESTRSITNRLADPHSANSFSARARARRWKEFERRFPTIGEMSVLDLGGTAGYWSSAPVRPGALTLLNLFPQDPPWTENARAIVGSACEPSPQLAGETFDLVVCNSVIGSVGGHEMRRRLAEVVLESGRHHWVQTPNRYFPVDPLFLFPGFAMLPYRARLAVSRHWPFGQRQAETPEAAHEHVMTIEYLTAEELRHYFPGSEIWRERLGGFTKSLVAIT
jgi:hypothetical protein